MRTTLLFLPGNQPNMIQNGTVLPCDALVFDLEDAVAANEKDAARDLVASALETLDFGHREKIVRVNDVTTETARLDIERVARAGAEALIIPKTGGAETVKRAEALLSVAEQKAGVPFGSVKLILLIETALGVEKAFEAASASTRTLALALGAEDLTASLGCPRTKEAREIFYSRSRIVVAARACGLEALDTPYTDARDTEGCYRDACFARSLGFTGKLSISPHHIEPIKRAFRPLEKDVAYAQEVVEAMRQARQEGRGAVSLRGKMIDPPVLAQAERTLALARAAGMIR